MKQIFIRIEDAEGERMKALAKKNDRSVSAEARVAIRNHLAQSNGPGAPLTEDDARAATKGV